MTRKILTRSTSVVKSSVSKMPLPEQTKKCLSKSPKRGASGKVSPKLTRKIVLKKGKNNNARILKQSADKGKSPGFNE